jgi:predicted peroxiredoxin
MLMPDSIKGLTIIWEQFEAHTAPNRLVFEMALVQRALGGRVTLFVTGHAVAHLKQAATKRDQLIPKLVGVPQMHTLLAEVLDSGARVIVCQTAAASQKMAMDTLDPRIEAGGLVSLMQGLGDDRLVVI